MPASILPIIITIIIFFNCPNCISAGG